MFLVQLYEHPVEVKNKEKCKNNIKKLWYVNNAKFLKW